MAEWHWPPETERLASEVTVDATLVVSELLSNAALYGGGPIELTLRLQRDSVLRIEVADGSTLLPEPRHRPALVVGGRGLHIVEQVSADWGVSRRPDGKIVWSEIGP